MKKITFFGSPLCPDCDPAREYLLENDINFEYIDITDSMRSLKVFLAQRDNAPFFDSVKTQGKVGIPAIMIGEGDEFYQAYPGMDLSPFK
jgi:glutaredoxin-related protein